MIHNNKNNQGVFLELLVAAKKINLEKRPKRRPTSKKKKKCSIHDLRDLTMTSGNKCIQVPLSLRVTNKNIHIARSSRLNPR